MYLSLSSIGSSMNLLEQQFGKEKLSRNNLVRDLYRIIETCLMPLVDIAINGTPGQTKNSKNVLLHLMLTLCVADISELEDLHDLNGGSKTSVPCYLCTARRGTFFSQTVQNYKLIPVQNGFWKIIKAHQQNPK